MAGLELNTLRSSNVDQYIKLAIESLEMVESMELVKLLILVFGVGFWVFIYRLPDLIRAYKEIEKKEADK